MEEQYDPSLMQQGELGKAPMPLGMGRYLDPTGRAPMPGPGVGLMPLGNPMGGILPGAPTLAQPPFGQPMPPTLKPPGNPLEMMGAQAAPAGQAGAPRQFRQDKFENALDFLDQVKIQFARHPRVYNQFLDIMKDFKTQSIDTPGVIARVSELFKGHPNLIRGFNTFLPPGFKIDVLEDGSVMPQAIAPAAPPPTAPLPTAAPRTRGPPPPPPMPAPARKQPEFDHARNYVKKIKMRFSLQPHIYKAFLEILHTYHKEQHTIKDVYDQVANLFQNHPDLLEEFTQFLPDPIPPSGMPVPSNATARKPQRPRTQKPQKPSAAGGSPMASIEEDTRRHQPQKRPRVQAEDKSEKGTNNQEELALFQKIKQKLSAKKYNDFLKSVNLFNQEIISRVELCILIKDVFGAKNTDIFDKFRLYLGVDALDYSDGEGGRGPKASTAWSEIDFSTCKRMGPSYRALPKAFVPPTCSGRTPLCIEVLNDQWVSVATGSEEGGFKNSRKNQYEEVLFKCEDDRYELDLVIELNISTLRVLEPYATKITALFEEEKANFRSASLEHALDLLQCRSIERIYGDAGQEVLDGLFKNPVVAIPVIVKRMRQKDMEWRKARRDWNKIWREVNEKNYYKSLDHQSFYFKQDEKKRLSPKVLVAEIKQKHQEKLKEKHTPGFCHLLYKFTEPTVFADLTELLTFSADKIVTKAEKEKVDMFLTRFVGIFFRNEGVAFPNVDGAAPEAGPTDMEGVSKAADAHAEADGKVKPVVTRQPDAQAQAQAQDRRVRLFFGGTSFYVFYRLYQTLYERVALAVQLARNPREKFNISEPPKADSMQISKEKEQADREKKEADAKKDRYKEFIKLLYSFVSNTVDQNKFEDELRDLLGIQAFPLYTLDKLVVQLVKQIQSILSDDVSGKLLALYAYEEARQTGFLENINIYNANALEILGEERCFKFEYELAPNAGQLGMSLLESVNQPRYLELSFNKEKWSQYVDTYAQGDTTNDLDVRKHHIFMLRNKRKNANPRVMENVNLSNGLECKICLTTYKLFYVEQTEDFFHRRRPARPPAVVQASRQKRQDKFHMWVKATADAHARV